MNVPQKYKNLARLAAVTFIQAALAVWAATGFSLDSFSWKPIIGGGVAALASLAYNMLRTGKTPISYSLEDMAAYVQENALIGAECPERPEEIDPDAMGFMGTEGLPPEIEVPEPEEVEEDGR